MTKNLVGYGHGRLGVNFAKAGEKHRIELHTTESRWSGPGPPGRSTQAAKSQRTDPGWKRPPLAPIRPRTLRFHLQQFYHARNWHNAVKWFIVNHGFAKPREISYYL